MARRHAASCRSRVASNNAGNVAGNARGSDRITYNCEFCPRTFYSSVMARRHAASCRSRVASNNAGNVAGNARGSENVLIGSNARRATANVLIESTAQTAVTDTSDDAEESENLLIGGTRQTAIPVFDNDVSYNLRRATYNDIDRLPVYKVKWNTFVGDTKGTKVCVSAGNECGICYERFKEGEAVTALPKCKHFFCYGCAARSLLNNASCPVCREAIQTK